MVHAYFLFRIFALMCECVVNGTQSAILISTMQLWRWILNFFTIILKIKQTFRTTLNNRVQDQSHGKQAQWILHGKFIVQMRKIKSKHVANSNVVYENVEKKKFHSYFKLAYFNIVKKSTLHEWQAYHGYFILSTSKCMHMTQKQTKK